MMVVWLQIKTDVFPDTALVTYSWSTQRTKLWTRMQMTPSSRRRPSSTFILNTGSHFYTPAEVLSCAQDTCVSSA